MFQTREVSCKFMARKMSEGAGASVHRTIGPYMPSQIDPLIMLDEFYVGLPGGFPDHPHRGFETVTYVLPTSEGSMIHEDFLGNKGELRAGDLQWMTPGRGIVHAEMPASKVPVNGLQLWINLPKSRKMMPPRYQEIKREEVPHVFNEEKNVEAIVFAGEVFGRKGPIQTEAPVTYIHFILKKGAKLEYRIPEGHNVFVYTLKGEGEIAGQSTEAHTTLVMEPEGDGIEATTSYENGVEFIAMSGLPLREPVASHGPFVMNTKEEIRQTIIDYQTGTNGFENAPHWESEIGRR
ncbi:hypothetical protein Poli38472_008220 [Pythium oligandrum]|uniref:Pirin n=1 Tax=Pythium oligandrum TaxID=41045 RepID=A0A8K1FPF7_PYTOL|nr:hypothetical protein Poli38472_008220 [Pythium oligandrum]|eukprot:TMW65578.1 hypothetical protein Poli38472_008220 [Pythium oligandrum]